MKTKTFYSGFFVLVTAALLLFACSKSKYNSNNTPSSTASVSI